MATRTVEIEDYEFEELEDERDRLLIRVEDLENRVEELDEELQELQEKWDDVEALLIRIGELG